MRRLVLALPLLILLGCAEKTPCEVARLDRVEDLQCVFADHVDVATKTYGTEDGIPVPFEIGPRQHPTGLEDGPSLWAKPWGAEWVEYISDPDAEDSSESQKVTVRADSLGPVATVQVSMDELHYALGMEDGRFLIRTIDHTTVLTGRVSEGTYRNVVLKDIPNRVTAFAFPSDRTVAVADGLGSVTMLSLDDSSTVWKRTVSPYASRLTVSPDGRRIAATSEVVTIWEADTGTEIASSGRIGIIDRVAFTEDGDHVAVRLRGVYVAPSQPSAVEVNPVINSAENIRQANSRSHGGYTPPDRVGLFRLP